MKIRLLKKWRREAYRTVFISPAVGRRGYRVWEKDDLMGIYNHIVDAQICCEKHRREYVLRQLSIYRMKYRKRLSF